MDVVLSYSRRDSEFADILYSLVDGRGYDVWIDRRPIAGSRQDRAPIQ